ncbi:MAG: TolC family protein [Bacteroidales bacterium]|nr:TolC family protein [Bacteroidales bacterium]
MSFHRLFLLALAVLVSAQVMAQTYTLDSCVAMALRSNKEIQAAHHQTAKYHYTNKALYANYLPKVSLYAADIFSTIHASSTVDVSGAVGRFTGDQLNQAMPYFVTESVKQRISNQVAARLSSLDPDIDFHSRNMLTASIMVEQPIYMGGKITAGSRMGAIGEKMSMLGEQMSREEIIVAVYEGYQLFMKAKEMRVVALMYDSLLVQLTHDVNSAIKHGMASHNDEMKVMVKKNDAELKVRQAENGVRLARMNLCQLIGLPLDSQIDVIDDNTALETVDLKNVALENRTEYMLLELKTQLAEQKVKLQVADYRPQIGMMMQVGVMDGLELMGEKMFAHQPYFNIGAVVKMPIYHGGEGVNKIRAARAELEQERMNQENLNEKMNLEVQQMANYVDEAILELSMRQRNVEQCEENLRISRKAYSVGMESLSELLTAQLLWQQAYAEQVESKFQVKIKMMKWRKAAGKIYQSSLFVAQ